MLSTSLVVAGLSTGHKIGLATVGGAFIVFALVSSFVLPQRNPSFPDIPTTRELGIPQVDVSVWHGLYAPKGTPKAAMDKLVAALQAGVKDDEVKKRFADLGATTYPAEKATPAALQAMVKSEMDKWGPLIKKAGVYAD